MALLAPARLVYRTVGSSPRLLRLLIANGRVSDGRVLAALGYSEFKPIQRRPEILGLAALLRDSGARSLLEIGTAAGGTCLLLARALTPPATVTSIDLVARYDRMRLLRTFARHVDVQALTLDSHDPATVEKVRALRPLQHDVVFIDGDHSYDGVRQDTLQFAACARPGGLLVFHDIQPASEGGDGVENAYVGGVPVWWRQISASAPERITTFLADPSQSGFGIGVLRLPDAADAAAAMVRSWSMLPSSG